MIDVHPPDHRIGGVRDFFLHLLTITVGLLIALGLENVAETVHHNHQRKEADSEIRKEIRENLSILKTEQVSVATEMKDLVLVLDYTNQRLAGKDVSASGLHVQLSESTLQDAAWRTSSATGVAQYMQYSTVEGFAACYKEQAEFEQMQQNLVQSYLGIEAFIATEKPGQLSDTVLREIQPQVRRALANLGGARDIGHGMQEACTNALKQ